MSNSSRRAQLEKKSRVLSKRQELPFLAYLLQRASSMMTLEG
ncbi:TPA: hypothetical protein ACQFK8_003198 [Proteus mirabilis]